MINNNMWVFEFIFFLRVFIPRFCRKIGQYLNCLLYFNIKKMLRKEHFTSKLDLSVCLVFPLSGVI